MYILYNGDIGQLVFFFAGVCPLEAKRFEIGGVSFRVISSPMNAAIRTRSRGSPDQNWPVGTKTKRLKLISNHSMVVSGTYYNPFQGFFTHSGASGRLRSHILTKNWPFLTPPANPVQFFGLKKPSKCVPWIVLQVLYPSRTSMESLRPPKRPSKAKNGQKITVFGPDRPILVWRTSTSGPNSGIHRRTYNSKRYPP